MNIKKYHALGNDYMRLASAQQASLTQSPFSHKMSQTRKSPLFLVNLTA